MNLNSILLLSGHVVFRQQYIFLESNIQINTSHICLYQAVYIYIVQYK